MVDSNLGIAENDFIELFIRHAVISTDVFNKAKQYKVTGDDFVLDEVFGQQIYKHIVDCIMSADKGNALTKQLLCLKLNIKLADGDIPERYYEDLATLCDFIYQKQTEEDSRKEAEFVLSKLKEFLKVKRIAKETYLNKDKPDILVSNLNSLIVDLGSDELSEKAEDIHPFMQPVSKTSQSLIGTGLGRIDEHIRGIGQGEFGIIVGYSGGGKTVFGTNIISNNAAVGRPGMYISLEEGHEDICQRFYSKIFEIPYSELHRGDRYLEIKARFDEPALKSLRETLARNLSLVGMKGMTPVNVNQIYEVMVKKYEKTGFVPEVVVIDQLQFVEPIAQKKSMQGWELERQTAAELDELSHKTIGGHKFALWVLHQAKGKLKKRFTRDEIDGFKGIIHKADIVLGIGRDDNKATDCDIFSLKVRHSADFSVTLTTDFKYMRFADDSRVSGSVSEFSQSTVNPVQAMPPLPPELPGSVPAPPVIA